MSMVVVKRYVGGYQSRERYSIRQRADGSFQIYYDNPFEGVDQPYQYDDRPISGLFADFKAAEAELLRDPELQIQSSDPNTDG